MFVNIYRIIHKKTGSLRSKEPGGGAGIYAPSPPPLPKHLKKPPQYLGGWVLSGPCVHFCTQKLPPSTSSREAVSCKMHFVRKVLRVLSGGAEPQTAEPQPGKRRRHTTLPPASFKPGFLVVLKGCAALG